MFVQPGEGLHAAAEGRQSFAGGGAGSTVRLNGNPADYTLEWHEAAAADGGNRYALVARNGTGEYWIAPAVERVQFVSGAYTYVRNLRSVIAAGDRRAARMGRGRPFRSYAQIGEDILLMRALRYIDPHEGFYIDVGAYDPDTDSVTRTFSEMGWRGINIEPSAAHHERLRARRPRDVNLCVAASNARGTLRFFGNDGEQLGTLEQRFADDATGAVDVPVVRLADVCRDHAPADVHFLKIDVEGHERSVLEGCDFARYRPWIVIMEAVAPNRAEVATFGEWEDILLDAGYRLTGEDELNRYYLADEHSALAHHFSLPADNYTPGADAEERERLTDLVAQLRAEVAALEATIPRREGFLRKLLRKLASIRRA